jgi:hypothetical protein
MPLNSVSTYLLDLLNGLPLPGAAGAGGNLAAYTTPPDPGELDVPTAYIWPEMGNERRLTPPRANVQGVDVPGWKVINHTVAVYLSFIGAGDDPAADTTFPAVIDAVMAALRPSNDQVQITDPVSGQLTSLLIGIGEEMDYEYVIAHSTADQRYLRYDAKIVVLLEEYFLS